MQVAAYSQALVPSAKWRGCITSRMERQRSSYRFEVPTLGGRHTQRIQNLGWDSGSVNKVHDLPTREPEFILRSQHPYHRNVEESETGRQNVVSSKPVRDPVSKNVVARVLRKKTQG